MPRRPPIVSWTGLLLLALALLVAPGLALAAECSPAPGDSSREMVLEKVTRTYDVHVPPSCDSETPIPLVFDFHGLTSTKESQGDFSGFREKADTEGFVVVHPQGYGLAWNSGWCCGFAGDPAHSLDDIDFVRQILETLAAELPIDRSRVYATGLSNGGAMSHWLACNAADWIAAAAPVSYHLSVRDACVPSRPIPVLQIHGTADETVPYFPLDQRGYPWPSAPDSIARWAELNGCEAEPDRTVDVPGVYCDEHRSCDEGATAALCTAIDAPHLPYFVMADAGVAIPGIAWDFFEQQTLAVPEPGATPLQLAGLASLVGLAARQRRSNGVR